MWLWICYRPVKLTSQLVRVVFKNRDTLDWGIIIRKIITLQCLDLGFTVRTADWITEQGLSVVQPDLASLAGHWWPEWWTDSLPSAVKSSCNSAPWLLPSWFCHESMLSSHNKSLVRKVTKIMKENKVKKTIKSYFVRINDIILPRN